MALDTSTYHWNEVIRAAANLYLNSSAGGGTTVTATAADPTYVEGSTSNPLSTDLKGYLRVIAALGTPASLNYTSISGTITAGATAQDLVAAASGFSYVELCNTDPSESLWFNDTGSAAVVGSTASTEIPPGGSYIWSARGPTPVPTDAISIIATTIAHPFRAKRA